MSESEKNREYWIRKYATSESMRRADVLLLPWENFREGHEALYPTGTSELFHALSKAADITVGIAVSEEKFVELSMHAKSWRLGTILVYYVMLPATAAVLATEISRTIQGSEADKVELEIIVEGHNGQCISIDYEGPAGEAIETILDSANKCIESGDLTVEPIENPSE
ncbi:MAG: hypothetical protein ACTS1X_10240 [Parasphingopyxis sp.]|uniref:hypothetical protein n=1 Tax=Parasphingopyxis sp. TaxID=1920299 RepID=UPI003FA04F28